MKNKNGFTLSEVVITLGIIGVSAALMGAAVGNAMPDKDKVKVLNLHQSITAITENVLGNISIYYKKGVDDTCGGLTCQYTPLMAPYNTSAYSGIGKYGSLLAANMKLKSGASVSETGVVTFTTTDEVNWTITCSETSGALIKVDLDGSGGNNCSYSSTCTKPDSFTFAVDKYGKITANDPLTAAYLNNPLKMNDKKNDYKTAKSDNTEYKTTP